MAYSRIYLVGFMGSGKSTVGSALAGKLGWSFIDIDREIERAEGRTISAVFQEFGEPHFRSVEREFLNRFSEQEQSVIALGGGAFMDPRNRELVRSTGIAVWLKVSFATVVNRVKMDGTRPMFGNIEQAEQLFRTRERFYQLAPIHVVADERAAETIADEITRVIATL